MAEEVVLTVENGPLAGKSYAFKERQVCVLGRADDCDIWIPGSAASIDISRHHCLLDIDPPHVRVRDLGSLNGTWVNGLPVGWPPAASGRPWKGGLLGESLPLYVGDELRMGHIVFRIRSGMAADAPPLLVEEIDSKQRTSTSARPGKKGRRRARAAILENVDLDAWTAVDLMTPEVISAPTTASLAQVTAVLMEHKVSAIVLTDSNGKPVGVISQTDLLAHDCTRKGKAPLLPAPAEPETKGGNGAAPASTLAGDLMTPRVFSVPSDTSGSALVTTLLSLQVHRLFVTGSDGAIIGVISRTDVLRRLHRSPSRRQARCQCELAAPVPS